MKRSITLILILAVVSLFAMNSFAQTMDDYPETVEIDGSVYTREIINGDVYYKCGEEYFTYSLELGEMMEAEITFP